MNTMMTGYKNLLTKKTHAIYDYKFQLALSDIPWKDWLSVPDYFRCRDEYLETFHNWIMSSQLNRFEGLERFSRRDIIVGTTQTFDEDYYRYRDRSLRVFRGEYAYHSRIVKDCRFLDDSPLERNDWLIISAPFCSTGGVHPLFYETLKRATELEVPVIVDCAYFGTCYDIDVDLDFECIKSVSFSLSKSLGMGNMRTGIRYSDYDDSLPIRQQNDYQHLVLSNAKIGIYMMKNFSPDFIPSKYMLSQKELCFALDLTPTNCVHLAHDNRKDREWLIDDKYYRVGIREAVKQYYKNFQ